MALEDAQANHTNTSITYMRSGTFSKLELVDENVDRFGEPLTGISTASHWFIAKFPGLAKVWGAPFLENRVMSVEGFSSSTPIAPNPSFMAAVLGHDDNITNSVVYFPGDSQFYYFEPSDQKYHAVPDMKLGELMRGYFLRCALELQKEVNVYPLFTTFCQDQTIKTIIERAKTILRCSDDYFSVDSACSRVNGIELHEKLAKSFVQKLVSSPGNILLVGVAYEKYAAVVRESELEPVKRSVFKEMMKPLIRERFEICLRNDLVVDGRYAQGWKDLALA